MAMQRLTVQEAVDALGTTVDAVRSRTRRGSIESEKDEAGRVFVWLDYKPPRHETAEKQSDAEETQR